MRVCLERHVKTVAYRKVRTQSHEEEKPYLASEEWLSKQVDRTREKLLD
ncbi:MAG: hypothetical protein H6Q75_1586 [Firmicutes bacterium]|nr:hypothetical protein [Bacillota bacterium]